MVVILFEVTYAVFGPFENAKKAADYLRECGFTKLDESYWVNGDAYVWTRPVHPPRIPLVRQKDSENCAKARRLFNTMGHGNDLMPESDQWLKAHLVSCGTCRESLKHPA
jgi:hypothetical protein